MTEQTEEVYLYLSRRPGWFCSVTRKRAFTTEKQARDYRRKQQRKPRGHTETSIRAYECDQCGYWHNTSMTIQQFNQLTTPKETYAHIETTH